MKWNTTNYKGDEVVWYSGDVIEKIKDTAKKALNMIDYKTYFTRNNYSLKQEGFKALQEIVNIIESEN
jgi:predicted solute-binding protein